MTRPTIVILVGLPGSGKTTLRADEFFNDYTVISSDDIVEQIASEQGTTYDAVWADASKVAADRIQQIAKECLQQGRNILWDQTNLSVKARRRILSQVPKAYMKIAIYFEIDEDLRQRRTSARVGKTIPAHVDAAMRASYVRPTVDEGFDYVLHAPVPSFLEVLAAA
jgi:predicted kinase